MAFGALRYCAIIISVKFQNISVTPKRNPVPLAVRPLPLPRPLAPTPQLSVSVDEPVLDVSCKGDRNHVASRVWLLSLSIVCARSVHVMARVRAPLLVMAEESSIEWMPTLYLPIHLLMDIWVVPTFRLL